MRVYWDSSALVAALNSEPDALRSLRKEQSPCTRLHTLAECFSQLTGGRLGRRFRPNDAALMIRQATEKFSIIDLTREDVQKALETAESIGVHDLLHAVAAEKVSAEFICTHNVSDFRLLTSIPVGLF
jgi:predicted nucleic acid-binding protein